MSNHFHPRPKSLPLLLSLLLSLCFLSSQARAQDEIDPGDEDARSNPVTLFTQAQDAQEDAMRRGDKEKLRAALELYEQALKLRPEFSEAEYQRGTVLIELGRHAEAEAALRRASVLNEAWALPHVTMGAMLARAGRDAEAETSLRRALEIERTNPVALNALADLLLRKGEAEQSLTLLKRATANEGAPASSWVRRARAERAAGDSASALASFERALSLDPRDATALVGRAEQRLDGKDVGGALSDLRAAEAGARSNVALSLDLARLYARAGQGEQALRLLDALDAEARQSPQVISLRGRIADPAAGAAQAGAEIEAELNSRPRDARLLGQLCALYRTDDPPRAAEFCRRALEVEPTSAEHATGYGAALVQAKQFADAARVLRGVLASAPQNYEAHANLATALDKLNLYREALTEYRWLNQARPELAVTHFFIARMHDQLREYTEALAAYETFLARADATANKLQIDQVNLRLPGLRAQIKRGEGITRGKGR